MIRPNKHTPLCAALLLFVLRVGTEGASATSSETACDAAGNRIDCGECMQRSEGGGTASMLVGSAHKVARLPAPPTPPLHFASPTRLRGHVAARMRGQGLLLDARRV
jgi:hypothetical protein